VEEMSHRDSKNSLQLIFRRLKRKKTTKFLKKYRPSRGAESLKLVGGNPRTSQPLPVGVINPARKRDLPFQLKRGGFDLDSTGGTCMYFTSR